MVATIVTLRLVMRNIENLSAVAMHLFLERSALHAPPDCAGLTKLLGLLPLIGFMKIA